MKKKLHAKVLLVDDEEDFIKTLSQRLEMRGINVSTATNGEDAVNLAQEQSFDAIVIDLAMPGMDGLATLTLIKKNNPDAEIIMLSGQGTVKAAAEAMKLGAGDFLEKPVDMRELLEKIEELKEKRIVVLEKRSIEEIDQILKTKAW